MPVGCCNVPFLDLGAGRAPSGIVIEVSVLFLHRGCNSIKVGLCWERSYLSNSRLAFASLVASRCSAFSPPPPLPG